MMAERAGVRVPRVDQVVKAGSGTALLVMDRAEGTRSAGCPRSGSATTSCGGCGLRWTGCTAPGSPGRPWLTDFSFSELAATQRQQDLDLAELLASLALLVGADRAVSSAAAVIGAPGLAAAVPSGMPSPARTACSRQPGPPPPRPAG